MTYRFLKRLLRPTVWVTVERAFGEIFALALFVVQAPILGPGAFGVVAAGMVFVYFWEGVPAAAVTEALLSVREIDNLHYSTATMASLLFCVAFGAALFAFAERLAGIFGSAELASILRVMAVLPLINAFSITPVAAAQRTMQFQTMTLRTTVGLIAGGIVGLLLTLTGAGAWALVWQALVQRLVANAVLWYAVPVPFGLALSRRHFRELAGFALPVMLAKVMSWGSGQLPRLILGIYMGPTKLGLFAIAQRLNAIVNLVAMEPKARVARIDLCRFVAEPGALVQAVRRVFLQIGIVSFPICIGGAAVAPTLFHAWLDSRWSEAIVPSQLLLLACVPYVTFYGATALLYAFNLQKWEAGVATVLNVSILIALTIGAPFGLVATTAAMAIVPLAVTPLPILVIRQKCGLSFRDVLAPQAPPFVAACFVGIIVSLVRLPLEANCSSALTLAVLVILGSTLYVLLIVALMPKRAGEFVAYLRGTH